MVFGYIAAAASGTFRRTLKTRWKNTPAPLGVYPNVRRPLAYRHRFIRALIRWKPDVIHSQCEFFRFQFALHIAKATGAPLVHTYHTLYEQYMPYVLPSRRLGNWLVRLLSRMRLKKVDRLIAPSRKVENVLLGYGVRNEICVIPSGIDLAQHELRYSGTQRREKRRGVGLPENALVLLSLGRLGAEKNLAELLELFAKAAVKNEDLWFLIVGDGPAKAEYKAKNCRCL